VLFSDLIVREMTEGFLRTDPRASDMASVPKPWLFPSSAKLLSAWAPSDQRRADRALV
jgi:hypothetical protein